MTKLIASVTEYVENCGNTTISCTVLLAIIEQAKTLQQEEQTLLKKTFVMGSRCKPEKAVSSAEVFYKSNFEKHIHHENKNKKVAPKRGDTKL